MTKLSRRAFLRGTVALGAGAVLYQYTNGFRIVTAAPGAETRQLRLIHTNDHHSRIEPAPGITIGRVNNANVTRNLGGVARRKTLFDEIRADATGTQDKLFLDAGDVFQGTLYFNQFNGAADLFFYNGLGYAAQAIGNHEFDKGDQTLANYIAGASFPIVAANITAGAASPLAALYAGDVDVVPAGQWGKRTIVTLASGEKVGIFGLTTVETANIASPSAAISFGSEYATIANEQAALLRAAGCNTVVALTHIGYNADLTLAAQLVGVNIVVGGHSHTPLLPDGTFPYGTARAAAYPQIIAGADGKSVVVVQDWEWAKWVGDITIGFDASGEVTTVAGATIRPVWADGVTGGRALLTGEGAEITPDATFQTKITSDYKPQITALQNSLVGATTVELSNANARAGEGVLGNLIADALRARGLGFADNTPEIPVVAIMNGGGIRTSIPAGAITLGKLLEVQPFGNTIARADITGAQLRAAIENGLSALQPGAALDAARNPVGSGRFPNVSGMRFTYNRYARPAQPPLAATSTQLAVAAFPGERVISIDVLERQADGSEAYVALVPTKTYRVITLNFVLNGGDGYTVFTKAGTTADPSVGGGTNQFDSGLIDVDLFADYIRALPNATITTEVVPTGGRITAENKLYFPLVQNGVEAPVATVEAGG
jgi:5'-nucleotidase / UDP-sugar diphosphatase